MIIKISFLLVMIVYLYIGPMMLNTLDLFFINNISNLYKISLLLFFLPPYSFSLYCSTSIGIKARSTLDMF